MAGTLALPHSVTQHMAVALAAAKKPSVVWLEFQDCAGCTESFLRAASPTVGDIVLNLLAVEYHETIMAASGRRAVKSLDDVTAAGGHIVVVEGAIPMKDNGVYCTIGGRTAIDILQQATKNAAAVIAVGNCAAFGNVPAAHPNPTGARGVRGLIAGVPLINVAGCSMNADNFTATLVHYLTFNAWPSTDYLGRPRFAFRERIHDRCERRGYFDAGQYVETWGDEGHRLGWCLYKMGCKGPQTYHNCPSQRWNEGREWPVGAGHGCIGCGQPDFWDALGPIYQRLPNVPGFGVEGTADRVGLALTGVMAAGIAAHAVGTVIRRRAIGRHAIPEAPADAGEPEPAAEAQPQDTQPKQGGQDDQDRH